MSARITKYMQNGSGGRNLQVTVLGVTILISADSGNQDRADRLAQLISDLGPENIEEAPPPVAPPVEQATAARPRLPFVKGERVWCNVHGAEGWSTVVEAGEGRNRGRIKISGERSWCPAHNFDREARR